MSEGSNMRDLCDQRYSEMSEHVARVEKSCESVSAATSEMQVSQRLFIDKLDTQFKNLSTEMKAFVDSIDEEIRGEKGPGGGPGIKQIVHDNKNKLKTLETENIPDRMTAAELKIAVNAKEAFPWRNIGVSAILAVVTGAIGALIAYMATN